MAMTVKGLILQLESTSSAFKQKLILPIIKDQEEEEEDVNEEEEKKEKEVNPNELLEFNQTTFLSQKDFDTLVTKLVIQENEQAINIKLERVEPSFEVLAKAKIQMANKQVFDLIQEI